MSKTVATPAQKRAETDLWIIAGVSLAALIGYTLLSSQLSALVKDDTVPILLRLLPNAFFQFLLAGLGMCIVCLIRKESFASFGLNTKNLLPAIALTSLMYVPSIILTIAYGEWQGYCPFIQVWTTPALLESGWLNATVGMLITATAWGFFEGFNYAVITDKINICLPSKHWWLDWGAIICAVMCILIHGAVGVTPRDILHMLATLVVIYGSLMVRKKTGNSWGLVVTFMLLWNAY